MISPSLAAIVREETRRALGSEPTLGAVVEDLKVILIGSTPDEARAILSELATSALEGLQKLSPAEPEPVVPDVSIAAPAAEQEAKNG